MYEELRKRNVVGFADTYVLARDAVVWPDAPEDGMRPTYLRLGVCFKLLFGEDFPVAHTAVADARANARLLADPSFAAALASAVVGLVPMMRKLRAMRERALRSWKVAERQSRSVHRECPPDCVCRKCVVGRRG